MRSSAYENFPLVHVCFYRKARKTSPHILPNHTSENIKAACFKITALNRGALLSFKGKYCTTYSSQRNKKVVAKEESHLIRDFNLALNYRNIRMWCGSNGQAKDKHVAWQGEDNKCRAGEGTIREME